MMDRAELFATTARLRRTFPRHADVLSLCDAAEGMAKAGQALIDARALEGRPKFGSASLTVSGTGPKRDRAAYMRDYRERKRG